MGVKHSAFLLVLMALSVKLNEGSYMCTQTSCFGGQRPNCLMGPNGKLFHQCTPLGTACPTAWRVFCPGGNLLNCPYQNTTCMCFCNSTSTTPDDTPQALVQS
nr:uncharacterized protein LOC129385618 [Dermacentor andersoni]